MPAAHIVLIHGVGQQYLGEATLRQSCVPAALDGLARAGLRVSADRVGCAFYGDLFRPAERVLGDGPVLDATDVEDGFERELLMAWWAAAAETDPGVPPPNARSLGRTPRFVQAALHALCAAKFFSGLTERALVADLRQVRRYFTEPEVRQAVQDRIAQQIGDDTTVLVGHSLGSVVAYEALCANPCWPVRTLVTLGSPLAIPNLIFDRLLPRPGDWPAPVRSWTNIADDGDVVALVKDLRPLFGTEIKNVLVHNGSGAHDMIRYLTSAAAGRAIADGLGEPAAPR